MVTVGVVYLICEDIILAEITSRSRVKPAKNHVARGLVGAQIGLVILAMLVTRHSALSLQARTGLPRGSQIVGWLTLSESSRNSSATIAASANLLQSSHS